jgi:hypothetical protein
MDSSLYPWRSSMGSLQRLFVLRRAWRRLAQVNCILCWGMYFNVESLLALVQAETPSYWYHDHRCTLDMTPNNLGLAGYHEDFDSQPIVTARHPTSGQLPDCLLEAKTVAVTSAQPRVVESTSDVRDRLWGASETSLLVKTRFQNIRILES